MKQKIKRVLEKPKFVIITTLVIAITAGVAISAYIQNSRTEMFSANTISVDSSQQITSSKNLTLAFAVGGRIKDVSVKIGDTVKKGDVLASLDSQNALGAVNQAQGAYTAAQNNYEKLINGATDSDIEIARVALNNAKSSYNNVVSQQKVLVSNALSALQNSGLQATPSINSDSTVISPTISGTYTGDNGVYTIVVYPSGNGNNFSVSGLESATGKVSTVPVPLGTHGLYIQFPNNFTLSGNNTWTVSIPNNQSPTYLSSYNAYQIALQGQTQATSIAQGQVDTAQANLDQKVAGTRSEDLQIAQAQVESTQGALQIAQGAYNNTIITAPTDGTITNVTITAGQIAAPNTPAIELLSK